MITKDEIRVLREKFEPKRQANQSRYLELKKLQREFVSKFPKDRIPLLSLDDYVEGKIDKDGEINRDSFCYWVEWKTAALGCIQGSPSSRFGVFCDKKTQHYKFTAKFKNENDAIKFQREQIVRLLEAGRTNNLEVIHQIKLSRMFKWKILFLYYPDQYLNIFSDDYINYFFEKIELPVTNDDPAGLDKRKQLLDFKARDEVMSKWKMYEFTDFLCEKFGSPKSGLGDSTLIADIKKIESNKTTDPTTVQALINARIGQGKFGSDVRKYWSHRCCVTGSSTEAALEASHIKRWADSNDAQRLDPNNGLLLTANLHKLFDAGLISFDDSGKMLVSSKLPQSEREIFGVIGKKLSKKLSPETANYLSYHRTNFLE
jgi:hypothetical protein